MGQDRVRGRYNATNLTVYTSKALKFFFFWIKQALFVCLNKPTTGADQPQSVRIGQVIISPLMHGFLDKITLYMYKQIKSVQIQTCTNEGYFSGSVFICPIGAGSSTRFP